MLFCLFSLLYHLATCEFMLPLSSSVLLHWLSFNLNFFLMNHLGRDADEAKAEEFNEMACKASLADQQNQLQENIHAQIKSFSMSINEILLPYTKRIVEAQELPPQPIFAPYQSGLGFDIGRSGQPTDHLSKNCL